METLNFTRVGDGPPLVFVHGFFGGAGHWPAQIVHFAPRFEVIAPSLAGFGDSAHLTAPETIAGHAAEVWATLDTLGIDRIILLGHSMGGMIVQEMTAQAPARVARLVLYGTGPVGALPGRFETLARSRARVEEGGPLPLLHRAASTWLVQGEAAPGFPALIAEGSKASRQGAMAGLAAMEAWDGTANLPGIAAPTLVLWGEHDRSYPRSQPEALVAGIPDSRLVVLEGCAHAAHLEDPDAFHAALDGFLG